MADMAVPEVSAVKADMAGTSRSILPATPYPISACLWPIAKAAPEE